MAGETGYSEDKSKKLIDRMQSVHNVIRYCKETNEVLLLNWWKYNWTDSEKLRQGVRSSAKSVKSDVFKQYITSILDGVIPAPYPMDTLYIPYPYPMDTSVPVTVTDTVSDTEKEVTPLELAMDEFAKFRKSMKKPLTDKGRQLTLEELEKLAPGDMETQIAIINQSIQRGWQGVFPLKDVPLRKYVDSEKAKKSHADNVRDFMAEYGGKT